MFSVNEMFMSRLFTEEDFSGERSKNRFNSGRSG